MQNKEKISQLHSLAKIGYLATGIFHDLISPLNAISLNLNQAKKEKSNFSKKIENYINQALVAALNMENLLLSVREQINGQTKKSKFNLKTEIKKIIKIINYQSKKEQVEITLNINSRLTIFGSKIKLNRVLINLLSNAIDACIKTNKPRKKIKIIAQKIKKTTIIQIIDNGCGIPDNIKNQLFKPFFSDKNGLGLGLSLSQQIIKQDFKGQIKTFSTKKNTIFQIDLNC